MLRQTHAAENKPGDDRSVSAINMNADIEQIKLLIWLERAAGWIGTELLHLIPASAPGLEYQG
jgi:hypothetical protein